MAKKTTLRTPKINEQGEKEYEYIYPQTLADIVHLEDGTSVEEKIRELEENSGSIKELIGTEEEPIIINDLPDGVYIINGHYRWHTSHRNSVQGTLYLPTYIEIYPPSNINYNSYRLVSIPNRTIHASSGNNGYSQIATPQTAYFPYGDYGGINTYVLINQHNGNVKSGEFSVLNLFNSLLSDNNLNNAKNVSKLVDVEYVNTAISQAITGVLEGEV